METMTQDDARRRAIVVMLVAATSAAMVVAHLLPAAVVFAAAADTNTTVGNSNTDCAQWTAGSSQNVSIGAGNTVVLFNRFICVTVCVCVCRCRNRWKGHFHHVAQRAVHDPRCQLR